MTIYTVMQAHFKQSKENIVDLMNYVDNEYRSYKVEKYKKIMSEYKEQLEEIKTLEKVFAALEKNKDD